MGLKGSSYSNEFYDDMNKTTRMSAEEMVPLLVRLVRPKSVVDVGCGTGIWLREFKKSGIKKILGIEGPWLERKHLLVNEEEFMSCDLNKRINLKRRFDLAISLEVAEHLHQSSAQTFVESLTNLSDVVVFSAAIPFQGGTNHLNEQYQDYWAELFMKKGYISVDCIRKKIWSNEKILGHYRQNTILYVKKSRLNKYSALKAEIKNYSPILRVVHPWQYERYAKIVMRVRNLLPEGVLNLIRPTINRIKKS